MTYNYDVGQNRSAYDGYDPVLDRDDSVPGMIINGILKFFELVFDCTIGFVIDKIFNIGTASVDAKAPSLKGRLTIEPLDEFKMKQLDHLKLQAEVTTHKKELQEIRSILMKDPNGVTSQKYNDKYKALPQLIKNRVWDMQKANLELSRIPPQAMTNDQARAIYRTLVRKYSKE